MTTTTTTVIENVQRPARERERIVMQHAAVHYDLRRDSGKLTTKRAPPSDGNSASM
jgi:hypothetical protein